MRGVQYSGLTKTAPPFVQDWLSREHVLITGIKLDPAAFPPTDAVTVNVDSAGADQGDTSVPVEALTGSIPSGTLLDFGGAKVARLTASAAAGDTTLTVSALPTALVDADVATYTGTQLRSLPRGSLVGRTYAERASNTPFGPYQAGDDEVFLTVFDVPNIDELNEAEVLRHNSVIYENRLPGYATMGAPILSKIRELYTTTLASD